VDEAQFYAASTDPITEQAPYYEPTKGEEFGRAALAIANKWGHGLDSLTLTDERPALKEELYNLLLLLVHLKSVASSSDSENGGELQNLLTRAAELRECTRSFYRLQAQVYQLRGDSFKAAEAQGLAEDDRTPTTALDHFLMADSHRTGTSRQVSSAAGDGAGQPDASALELTIEEYRKAIELDPNHYWSHFQVGRCYLGLGKRSEAVEALRTFVALRPDSPWSHSTLGFALAQKGHVAEALRSLNRAVDLGSDLRSDFRPARLNRGMVYWLQKDYDEALAEFDAVLEPPDDKKLFEAAFYRGQLRLQLALQPPTSRQKLTDTLPDFNLVAEKKPNFAPVFSTRARVYFLVGKDNDGMVDLNRFLALTMPGPYDPNAADACFERGKFLRRIANNVAGAARKKKFEQARVELETAVARGGHSAALCDELGAVLESLGAMDEAIVKYSEGIELAPEDFLLRDKRGWIYVDRATVDLAEGDFAAMLRVEPKKPFDRVLQAGAHAGLARVHVGRSDEPAARREVTLALTLPFKEEHWLVQFKAATVYAQLSTVNHDRAAEYREVKGFEIKVEATPEQERRHEVDVVISINFQKSVRSFNVKVKDADAQVTPEA
jgi:tetratricopeptide (TPR) repeat protein